MRIGSRAVDAVQWLLVGLCLAGIIHIVSVLAMPHLAPKDAYSRVAALAPVGTVQTLPRTLPGQELFPFSDPSMATGLCRYDLADGPFRIRARASGQDFLSVSFHDRWGTIYYAMTDRVATRGIIEALVLTPAQLEVVEAGDAEDEQPQELRITAPSPEGFVLFRALATRPGLYAETEADLKTITCGAEPKAVSELK
jgi:uncharacterized membrane protein